MIYLIDKNLAMHFDSLFLYRKILFIENQYYLFLICWRRKLWLVISYTEKKYKNWT